jgi:hypothetical protein
MLVFEVSNNSLNVPLNGDIDNYHGSSGTEIFVLREPLG